jgi:hypothetical protein
MVAFADVVQTIDRLQKVVETAVPALQSSLPSIEVAGREAMQRAIGEAASKVQSAAPTVRALAPDVGMDVVVAKVDPTAGIHPKTFTVEGPAEGHPWIKEDSTNLTHATEAKTRHDRERGRGPREPIFNPIPNPQEILPWAKSSPPMMREGAQMQNRHPLMKF